MGKILSKPRLNQQLDYGLGYATNWRGIEAFWYPLWTDYFTTLLHECPTGPQRLAIAPQHPLIQWGVPKSEIVGLESDADPQPLPFRDLDDYMSEDDSFSLRIKPLRPDDDDYTPPAGNCTAFEPIQKTLRSASKLRTSPPGGLSHTESIPSAPEDVHPPPASHSSSKTRNAQNGIDSSFLVDFAIIHISKPSDPSAGRIILDHITFCRHVHIPIMLEIKTVGTRTDGIHIPTLSAVLREAYGDIQAKAPAAFSCHSRQLSIIGIAAVGPWWSFTLIAKGTLWVEWSVAYSPGKRQHDSLLRKLFLAAMHKPHDPINFEAGCLKDILNNQKQRRYNETDCLATVNQGLSEE